MTQVVDPAPLKAVYLLELDARAPGGVTVSGRTDYGDLAYGEAPVADVIPSGVVTERYASEAYRTLPSDTPANTRFAVRLAAPFAVQRQIALGPGESGIVSLDLGSVELLNDDGGLDNLVRNYAVDGRAATVKVVDRGAAYSTARTLFAGTAAGWSFAARNTVKLDLRGQVHRLSVPLQTNLYAGTGGAEGGDDIKGKPKPLAYGKPLNIAMPLVAPATLTYQFHDGASEAVDAVYDGQVALTFNADYPTFADLIAATTPEGSYDTCLAESFIQVGSPPVYGITADVQGDNSDDTFRSCVADIVRHWLEGRLNIGTGDLDTDAFDALATLQPAVCDFYATEPVQAVDAINGFMAGIGAWLGDDTSGKFTCARIDIPADPIAGIDESVITDAGFSDLSENISPCIWRVGVGWGYSWAGTGNQIAAGADAARRSFVGQQTRVEYAADASILQVHALAVDHPPIEAYFHEQADAAAEAARLLALWSVPRRSHSLQTKAADLGAELGDVITYTSSRYGLDGGVPVVICSHGFTAGSNELVLGVLE